MFSKVGFWQSILAAATAMGLLKISIALNLLRLSPSRWYSWPLWASIGMIPRLDCDRRDQITGMLTKLFSGSVCRGIQHLGLVWIPSPLLPDGQALGH